MFTLNVTLLHVTNPTGVSALGPLYQPPVPSERSESVSVSDAADLTRLVAKMLMCREEEVIFKTESFENITDEKALEEKAVFAARAPKQKATLGLPRQQTMGGRGGMSHAQFLALHVDGVKNPRDIPSSRAARGRSEFTLEEVARHNTRESAWTVYKGFVYDLTPYLQYHPGGSGILMETAAGKDCTDMFQKVHCWVNMGELLGKYKLGKLVAHM
ncbi:MAG: uncharacterized protein KVP18_002408 [Porospora cf. gigantea A]|uniref:uncharacterized protein n=1 Tax=Porospora cf. gigantea A TaxID=2853593 RepID=UPI003559485E|nr:MAG: hypothetical protein KVP18_002408 [Porospora cf. gigantea A]